MKLKLRCKRTKKFKHRLPGWRALLAFLAAGTALACVLAGWINKPRAVTDEEWAQFCAQLAEGNLKAAALAHGSMVENTRYSCTPAQPDVDKRFTYCYVFDKEQDSVTVWPMGGMVDGTPVAQSDHSYLATDANALINRLVTAADTLPAGKEYLESIGSSGLCVRTLVWNAAGREAFRKEMVLGNVEVQDIRLSVRFDTDGTLRGAAYSCVLLATNSATGDMVRCTYSCTQLLYDTAQPTPPVTGFIEKSTGTASAAALYFPLGEAEYYITSQFGQGGHRGIDLVTAGGTPIYAAHSGTVTTASPHASFGNYVVIRDAENEALSTLYAHMQRYTVAAGDNVRRGDLIGYVGCTGYSTTNHLHFEVSENGWLQNPAAYWAQAEVQDSTLGVGDEWRTWRSTLAAAG